jgi:hypothetical protein
MLPLEASSIIGSIGGIAEIAREAFGGSPPTGPQTGKHQAGIVPPVAAKI